jgi:hypothetical protein
MTKNQKRFIISLAFLFILVVLSFGIHSLFSPEPTCNDGIRNQLEEGVDCGGPCKPCPEKKTVREIDVVNKEWANVSGDKFDIAIKVKNDNSSFGAEKFDYRAEFLSGGETIKVSNWQESFILPEMTKHILIQNISLPEDPDEVKVEIQNIQWKEYSGYVNPKLPTVGNRFEGASGDNNDLARVVGTLSNESNVDFETIKVKAFLRNQKEELIAVNSQIMNTVRAGEKRDFKMVFPSDYYLSEVSGLDIETETNIFNSENYIKTYGEPQNPGSR